MLKNKQGFTLIELLVVITIIGILATGAVTIYTAQIQKARDTTRINDMKALQSAVEQVYQDSGEYPHSDEFATGGTVNVRTYMEKIPEDPKSTQTCNGGTACDYLYIVADDSNSIAYGVYELSTGLENDGNVSTKAATSGNDPVRFELGLTTDNLVTTHAGGITTAGCLQVDGSAAGTTTLIKLDTAGCD